MDWITEADGVFRGGGVKGLALAGALCGFAEHPTKPIKTWKCVAGASAGAIIACYLATGHSAAEMLEGATFGPLRKPAQNGGPPDWSLKLIAVDVTKRRLLVLPDDIVFYRE